MSDARPTVISLAIGEELAAADPRGHRTLAQAYRSLDLTEDAESEEELAAALEPHPKTAR